MQSILQQFNINSTYTIETINIGLINATYKIITATNQYILQKINTAIFKTPNAIDHNITTISNYIQKHNPNYLFTHPIKTISGATMLLQQNEYWRLFSFIPNSHSKQVLTHPNQAYQAAIQFANFTNTLQQINIDGIKTTIPDFHNLTNRYQQFELSLIKGNKQRIAQSNNEIIFLQQHSNIVDIYNQITTNQNFKKRITHHDTKISNILFNNNNEALCVIDLDTVMPGYFISDVGDMMRTYLCAFSEEETDFSTINIRPSYYDAINNGYLSQMKNVLSNDEITHFNYAGSFIIYMQALRFLTDFFNNDIYYGATYPQHNYNRAINQITLLQQYHIYIQSIT